LSLVLFGATAVLWIRSYWRTDWVAYSTQLGDPGSRQARHCLQSEPGTLVYARYLAPPQPEPGWKWFPAGFAGHSYASRRSEFRGWADEYGRRLGGFGWVHIETMYGRRNSPLSAVFLPHGFAVLAFAALPVWWAAKRRAARRAGCCPTCGYDLRATPDRCPECGAVVRIQSVGGSHFTVRRSPCTVR
jgi:hypothetical protein